MIHENKSLSEVYFLGEAGKGRERLVVVGQSVAGCRERKKDLDRRAEESGTGRCCHLKQAPLRYERHKRCLPAVFPSSGQSEVRHVVPRYGSRPIIDRGLRGMTGWGLEGFPTFSLSKDLYFKSLHGVVSLKPGACLNLVCQIGP